MEPSLVASCCPDFTECRIFAGSSTSMALLIIWTLLLSHSTVHCSDVDWDQIFRDLSEFSSCSERFLCRTLFPSIRDDADVPWNQSIVTGPNEMDDEEIIRSCHCDEKCIEYGDCCVDAAALWSNKASTIDWQCLPLNKAIHWEGDLSSDLAKQAHVYMINDCPDGDTELAALCRRHGVDDEHYTYLSDVPVWSMKSNVTYANIFCAACHDDADHIASWNSEISCEIEYYANNSHVFNVTEEILNLARYKRNELRWYLPRGTGTEIRTAVCALEIKEFQNVTEYIRMANGRRCIPRIDTCPSGSELADRLKCDSPYTLIHGSYRFDDDRLMTVGTYKNVHCFRCSNLTDQRPCPRIVNTHLYSGSVATNGIRLKFPLALDLNLTDLASDRLGFERRCRTGYKRRGFTCVPFGGTLLDPLCHRISLTDQDFHFNEDGLLVLNVSGKSFNSSYYREVNGTFEICTEESYDWQFSTAQRYLSTICLSVSAICLVLHIVISLLLQKLKNLPSKNLLSLSCALLGAQLLFLTGVKETELGQGCTWLGFLMHWFFLCSFFWMNVMALDTCRTFSSRRHRTGSRQLTFGFYSLYAWGCPSLIVGLALVAHFTLPESPSSPRHGSDVCWISRCQALGIFFNLPVALLLSANVCMFGCTVYSILEQKKAAAFAADTFNDGRNELKLKFRLVLYIKLASIMGLCWVFAFLASVTHLQVLWFPFIILNGLKGLCIFFSFDFKMKTYVFLLGFIGKLQHPALNRSSNRRPISSFANSTRTRDRK